MAPPAVQLPPIRPSPLEGLMPRTYIRQIYCFPTSDSPVISTLLRGLGGLAQDVPYILSRVLSNKTETSPSLTISAPCLNLEDVFSWHDLSDSIDYVSLKAGNFPPEEFLAPGIIPSDTLPPYPALPAIFLARAALVKGGLILCMAVYHAVTDITGYDALVRLWSSHCRDGSSRNMGFNASWMDRSPLFSMSESLLSPPGVASMPDLLHIRTTEEVARLVSRSRAGQAVGSMQKNYQTAIFYFPQQRLRALKDAVNAHITSREPGSWVSTGDILSSLLWSAILEAEDNSSLLGSNEVINDKDNRISTLSFPVQFRSVLRPPLPRGFLGAAFLMTNAKVLHREVCLISRSIRPITQDQDPNMDARILVNSVDVSALAKAALAIRKSIKGIDDATVRRVLAYLEAHVDTNPNAPLILGPPRIDAGGSAASVVSWADQDIYGLDWGDTIGRCDAVRLSKMGHKRDPIILPRVPSLDGKGGGFEVIMCYEENTMRRLIEGPVMKGFAGLRCLS